jgi:uncharacterized protein (DUF2147 family)
MTHGTVGRALAGILALAAPAAAQAPPNPAGVWRNGSGSVHLRLARCGKEMCGTVVRASEQAKADAARGGTQNLIGLDLFENFTPVSPGVYQGRVFVPDLNRRFNGRLTMTGPNSIEVRGCLARNVGCRSQTWTRVRQ